MAVDKLVDSAQLNSDLRSIANAIRTKGGTSSQLAFPSGFVSAIQNIPSGPYITETEDVNGGTIIGVTDAIDLSSDTVSSATLLQGYTAHDHSGNAITGTYSGSGPAVQSNDVNFYDYDGTILFSYTKSEFLGLSAMPANPSHSGLTAQGWNWTLSDAQSFVSSYGYADIGQQYITSDGKTRLYITIDDADLLCFRLNLWGMDSGSATIDWGDGTTEQISIDYWSSTLSSDHTYQTTGDYVISISVSSGIASFCNARYKSPFIYPSGWDSFGINEFAYPYMKLLKKVEIGDRFRLDSGAFECCVNLETITLPATSYLHDIGSSAFSGCKLKAIIFPSTTDTMSNSCSNNMALEVISLPIFTCSDFFGVGSTNLKRYIVPPSDVLNSGYGLNSSFQVELAVGDDNSLMMYSLDGCYYLKKVVFIDGTSCIPEYVCHICYGLETVTIPSSVSQIETGAFSGCSGLKEIHFLGSSPCTVDSDDAFQDIPPSCKIYVPTAALSAYQSATNYPDPSVYTYIGE